MIENLMVFDIDDTLTKSEVQHQHAYIETMKHFGIKNVNQNWIDYKHMTDSFILKENYEKNLSKPFDFSIINQFEAYMSKRMLALNPVNEIMGANDMIREIKAASNYSFCCATGSFYKPALLKLNQAKISIEEDLVVGSNTSFTREEIVQKAINKAKEYYKVKRFKNIISVGDGIWDYKTASNLGIHFVGIGKKNKIDFLKQNIRYHIENWTKFNLGTMELKLGINNMKTFSIYLLFFAFLMSCSNVKEPNLVLNANSNIISIREDNLLKKDIWEASSELKLDEFVTNKFIGTKDVTFYSDIDSISFKVEPNRNYDFAIVLNAKDTAFTRISTKFKKEPSLVFPLTYTNKKNRQSKLDTIPFRLGEDNRIYLKGTINNSKPLKLMFDTGASANVLVKSIIGDKVTVSLNGSTVNSGSDGVSTVSISSGNTMNINNLVWDNVRLLVIDYGSQEFDGVLGWISFENKIIEIDYNKQILVIHKSMETIPSGFAKIDTKQIGSLFYIKGTTIVNNKESEGWLEFDTGYDSNLLLSQHYAKERGLNNVMKSTGTSNISGSTGVNWKANNYILPTLKIGSYEVSNVHISIYEKDPGGDRHNDLLGNELLKKFNAVIDFKNYEIYLKPNNLYKNDND